MIVGFLMMRAPVYAQTAAARAARAAANARAPMPWSNGRPVPKECNVPGIRYGNSVWSLVMATMPQCWGQTQIWEHMRAVAEDAQHTKEMQQQAENDRQTAIRAENRRLADAAAAARRAAAMRAIRADEEARRQAAAALPPPENQLGDQVLSNQVSNFLVRVCPAHKVYDRRLGRCVCNESEGYREVHDEHNRTTCIRG